MTYLIFWLAFPFIGMLYLVSWLAYSFYLDYEFVILIGIVGLFCWVFLNWDGILGVYSIWDSALHMLAK